MRRASALKNLLSQAAQASSKGGTAALGQSYSAAWSLPPSPTTFHAFQYFKSHLRAGFRSFASKNVSTCSFSSATLAAKAPTSSLSAPFIYASRRSYASLFPSQPSFNWSEMQTQLKKRTHEWTRSHGYNQWFVVVNALYTTMPSTHWVRLVSIMLAEAVTRGDPLAWCYKIPVSAKEEELLAAAEEADEKAAIAANKGIFRTIWRYVASYMRLMWLLFLFTPAVLSAPVVFSAQHEEWRKEWMKLLRRTLERAGPAFIKWGQWAATRADLFPPDFCSELELLHTQAPAHTFPFTEAAVEASFGFRVKDLFSEFETEPVASGSIGQIHRAVLSGAGGRLTNVAEGSVVAVKVRHPGVSESIERDFALMMAAAKVADLIPALKSLRLEESLKQFAAPLREQVDLGREGFYLHAFNYNFRREHDVSFPIPLYPLVSPAVLVETFEAGEHISAYVARGAGAPYNSELAQVGARTMLHMMVVDNLVHSDLHPGNILVRLVPPGGALGAAALQKLQKLADVSANKLGLDFRPALQSLLRPSIVLLDAGMATRLGPEDQINMVGLFDAFSRLDARAVANWTLRFAGEEQTCQDPEAFREDLERHFSALKASNAFAVGDTSSGAEALAAVLETVRLHQVNLPGHICATVVTTLVLEGWSHALDPAHSTLSEVKRIIALKKGETKLRKAAMWIQGAAVERQILEHVPQFALEEGKHQSWKIL